MNAATVLLLTCGGALAIEGAAWAIFPAQMRKAYSEMFAMGDRALHISGLISVAIGVALIALGVNS